MIVVGVDGEEQSLEALRFALHEAAMRGTRVRAVLAWSAAPLVPMTGPGVVATVEPDALRESAEERLRRAVEAVAGDRAGDVEQVLAEGPAGEAILDHAQDAELVVVGTHARGAIAEFFLGSVSHHVVKHSRSPVVVVPPPRDDEL